MQKIVIILPTYNESGNIKDLIEEIEKVYKQIKYYKKEILVVDDNSPDGTGNIVKQLQKKYSNISLITSQKKGLGHAYVRGMRYALDKMDADILFEMDADFSHNPNLIPNFINKLENGADFVIGSRYVKGGSIPKEWGLERKIFSVLGNFIVRFGLMTLRVRDWTSGYRAIRRRVFEHVGGNLNSFTGYTFQVAFLHRVILKGFTIAEIPINFIDRKYGKSKIIPSDYIKNLVLYIFFNSSFIKFLFVGVTGFAVQTLISHFLIERGGIPGLSVGVGAEAAIISNFLFNQFWTFSHKKIIGKRKLVKKFIGFNSAAITAIVIQSVAVTVGTYLFGRDAWFFSMVLAIILFVVPYSYFIYHKVIWKEKKFETSTSIKTAK